ncbi:hypothetical protein [Sagittula sp. SSi028]|uniref:hypothetical protein n=1 Tax=Sagittula sp. SSi028 TaxID=3400636 RepID=UPI003AF49257
MAFDAREMIGTPQGRLTRTDGPMTSSRLPAASWFGLAVAVTLIVAAALVLTLSPNTAQQQLSQLDRAVVTSN